ncbi:hypothetical protein Tco_0759917 [Tanacetum coccineum]
MPYDSPLPRGHTLGSDEGIMQHNELMDLVTKLSDRVVALETDLQQTKKVYGAAFTKLIKKEDVSTAKPVSTAGAAVITTGVEISIASPEVKTAGNYVDDIAVESLVYIRRSATKTKDKGKGIMEESESTMTMAKRQQKQERLGLKTAMRLREEFDEEERARIEADEELAQRTQAEEREKYTEVEQARMLVELNNQRKNYFATQKAEAKKEQAHDSSSTEDLYV